MLSAVTRLDDVLLAVQVSGASSTALLAAAVGATATLAASVVTQLVAAARERHRLLDERRRAVVLDAQDAAHEVREALRHYGRSLNSRTSALRPGGPNAAPDVSPSLEDRVSAARGRLEVRLSRVHQTDVIQAVELWLDAAQETFLSPREGRPAQEERRWVNLQTRVRATLGLEPVR